MKVSLNWAREFTDVKLSVDQLVEKIGAQLGAVEEVIDLTKKYHGIIVAKVVTCEKHPNADKLNVCKIDDGGKAKGIKRDEKGLVQVVCGAPNVKAGMLVAWLPPGAIVPSTYDAEQFKLDARDLRGVVSNGMLASPAELGLGTNHDGILEVDYSCQPGEDFGKLYKLDDIIIDIENKMFTHRPDCFGQLGVAREIAGICGVKFNSPDWYKQANKKLVPRGPELPLTVKNELPKLVPRFMAVAISGVEVKPSPVWLQSAVVRAGSKPINNVVDLTNYFMLLTGQPLHAYDYDKVLAQDPNAKKATLTIRNPKKGEKLTLLGGKQIEPYSGAIVIASATKPIGLGGIMGGADTEVDENTKNIILECATFDMYAIRKTAMEHGLFTDAATRFNKGQSPLQNDKVIAEAGKWLVDIAGREFASNIVDDNHVRAYVGAVRVSAEFINERLGLNLTPKKIADLLENVEFKVLSFAKGQLGITPPFWRTDIEIPEDIVEEVGRLYGYDHLPLELPNRDFTPAKRNKTIEFKNKVRQILSKAGANELLTYSFVHGDLIDKVGQDKTKAFQLSNAVSPDLQYYRLSLTPSLLDKVHPNIKAGVGEFALFEIGRTHIKGLMDEVEADIPAEEQRLSLVISADDKIAANYSGAPYYQALKYLDELLGSLNIDYRLEILDHQPHKEEGIQLMGPFNQERTAAVRIDGQFVGLIGEFKPQVYSSLKLPKITAGFELDIEALHKFSSSQNYTPISRFPKVWQDISLKVKFGLSYGELYAFLSENLEIPEDTTANLTPVDIYQREEDKEHKQVTLRLTIASNERTLTDGQVNKILDDLAAKAHTQFAAERL